MLSKFVTWSGKTGLIAHNSRFIFFLLQTQNYIIRFHCHWVNWSAYAGCFFQAQWRAVRVVLDLNGALANK